MAQLQLLSTVKFLRIIFLNVSNYFKLVIKQRREHIYMLAFITTKTPLCFVLQNKNALRKMQI